MVDYPQIAALRGTSLSTATQHVADVLRLSIPAQDDFQTGTVQLAGFEFAGYAVSGMAAAMQTPTAPATRATTTVTVPLSDDAGGTAESQRNVTLYGPGDVIGVDPGQILRRYPTPGSLTAEETFHAHIEFDRPELPWAFSAQTPAAKMRPWLTLLVLQLSEVSWEPITAGTAAVLSVDSAVLPRVEDVWALAHAQASAGSAPLSTRLSTAYAPVNLSRLLASRVLTQDTSYVACLVPTTDVGVRAGLGLDGGTLGPGWQPGSGTVRLPVYDHWEFSTAPDGDFARLARKLVAVAAPWRIGRRIMDTARPGLPLTDLAADEPGRRQVIRCALFSPNAGPAQGPTDTDAWSAARTDDLRTALDRPAVVEGRTPTAPGQPPDLPIIGPRLYAQNQRGARQVVGSDWFAELNLAPVDRVAAGLGTRVVVKDQEALMQAAWAQVGTIDRANRALNLGQFGQALAGRLHSRITGIDPARLLALTRPMAPRVRLDGAGLTLWGQVDRSSTASAVLSGALRKTVRPAGRMAMKFPAADRSALAGIAAPGGTARDLQRPVGILDGITGLSSAAIASLDPSVAAAALSIPSIDLTSTLTTAGRTLATRTTLAGATTITSMQGRPDPTYSPAAEMAGRIQERILAGAQALAADDLVGARWFAGLAAGLAPSLPPAQAAPLIALASQDQDRLVAAVSQVTTLPGRPTLPGGPVFPGQPTLPGGPVLTGHPMLPGGPVLTGHPMLQPAPILPVGTALSAAPTPSGTAEGLVPGALLRRGAARVTQPIVDPATSARGAIQDSPVLTRPAVDVVGTYLPRVPTPGQTLTTAEKLSDVLTSAGAALGAAVVAINPPIGTVAQAVVSLVTSTGVLDLAGTPVRPALGVTPASVTTRLAPRRTIVDAVRGRLTIGISGASAWLTDDLIRPIMAAPHFDRAMYQALDDYDRNWLVPGLGMLPITDMVTILEANDKFTEAFLIGLSDEMGRELLWREYPTDQRGTYFRRFWDATKDELAQQLHRFTATPLGSHLGFGPQGQSGRAVVVVRGELVRRYPDLTVMALKGQPGPGGAMTDELGRPYLPEAPTGPDHAAPTLFTAFLSPDVMLAGLDITTEALRSGGWWIVLAEHPQAPRFRRKEPDLVGHEVRFAWIGGYPNGPATAADRLENPTRIAFEAGDFLPPS